MATKKKTHWTQRPENKARVQAMLKKASAAKQASKKNRPKARQSTLSQKVDHVEARDRIQEGVFSYALGYVECWISTFAASADVSAEALAAELGAVLSRKVRR